MISRHHSERDHSANSGRASTWSIRARSSSEMEILSTMGTLAVSGSLERAMHSKYPEQPGWNASVCASSQPRITRRRACAGRKTTCSAIRSKSLTRQGKISSRCWCGPPMSGPSGSGSSVPGSRGAVAQLVAHLHGMEGVRGSNPLSSTEKLQVRGSPTALILPGGWELSPYWEESGRSCPPGPGRDSPAGPAWLALSALQWSAGKMPTRGALVRSGMAPAGCRAAGPWSAGRWRHAPARTPVPIQNSPLVL